MAQESEKTLLYRERKAFEGGITLIKPNYKFENTTDTLSLLKSKILILTKRNIT